MHWSSKYEVCGAAVEPTGGPPEKGGRPTLSVSVEVQVPPPPPSRHLSALRVAQRSHQGSVARRLGFPCATTGGDVDRQEILGSSQKKERYSGGHRANTSTSRADAGRQEGAFVLLLAAVLYKNKVFHSS